ncbi:15-cis-zeta-carotene isomerase, chloroplastic, partial [Olea europaea subsp. europaea]
MQVGRTEPERTDYLVGEDSAQFDLSKQKILSWVYFIGVAGVVAYVLYAAWIDSSTGFGKPFIEAVSSISESPE